MGCNAAWTNGFVLTYRSVQNKVVRLFPTTHFKPLASICELPTIPRHICGVLFLLENLQSISISPYLDIIKRLHKLSGSFSRRQPSLANNAIFILCAWCKPTLPTCLVLHICNQLTRCIFLFDSSPPYTQKHAYLFISLVIDTGKGVVYIWYIGRLVMTNYAKVLHPTNDKHIVFHPTNLF